MMARPRDKASTASSEAIRTPFAFWAKGCSACHSHFSGPFSRGGELRLVGLRGGDLTPRAWRATVAGQRRDSTDFSVSPSGTLTSDSPRHSSFSKGTACWA